MNTDTYIRKAIITKVIDGDTIEAIIDLGYHVKTTQRFRLLRVNCPETHGDSKVEGVKATEFTSSKVLNKEVYIKSFKTDSFQRWLGEVYFVENNSEYNLSDELLKNGFAVKFMTDKVN